MQLTYQFRLYPKPKQEKKMFHTLTLCRQLYNAALEQREIAYKEQGKSVFYSMQQKELPALKKEIPEYKEVHSQILQDVLQRFDHAFDRFFKKEAGYPRYKSRDRYTSFTYTQPSAVKQTFAKEGYVYLSKIGFVQMNVHREFDPMQVTQMNVKYHAGQWVVNISAQIPATGQSSVIENAVGIDVGLQSFASKNPSPRISSAQRLSSQTIVSDCT